MSWMKRPSFLVPHRYTRLHVLIPAVVFFAVLAGMSFRQLLKRPAATVPASNEVPGEVLAFLARPRPTCAATGSPTLTPTCRAKHELEAGDYPAGKRQLAVLLADRAMARRLEEIDARRWGLMGNTRDPAFARNAYPKALAECSALPEQLAGDTQILARSRIGKRVLAALDAWLEVDPANPALLQALSRIDPDADRCTARSAIAAGDANRVLDLANRREGKTPPALARLLGSSRLLADDKAIRLLKVSQAAHPDDVLLTVALATRLLAHGSNEDAIAFYLAALNKQSDCSSALAGLSTSLCGRGRYNEAITVLRGDLERHPERAWTRNLLAFALTGKGQLDEAVAVLQDAIRIDPGDMDAQYSLAWTLNRKGRSQEALAVLNKAIEADANNSKSHATLAALLYKQGRGDDAVAAFRNAIKLDPANGETHLLLGTILCEKRRFQEAVPVLRKAVALRPTAPGRISSSGLPWRNEAQ